MLGNQILPIKFENYQMYSFITEIIAPIAVIQFFRIIFFSLIALINFIILQPNFSCKSIFGIDWSYKEKWSFLIKLRENYNKNW